MVVRDGDCEVVVGAWSILFEHPPRRVAWEVEGSIEEDRDDRWRGEGALDGRASLQKTFTTCSSQRRYVLRRRFTPPMFL